MMTDFSTLRQRMVDNQVRTSGVVDHAVLRAFLAVPRELFVEAAEQPFAYADRDVKMSARSPHRAMMPRRSSRASSRRWSCGRKRT